MNTQPQRLLLLILFLLSTIGINANCKIETKHTDPITWLIIYYDSEAEEQLQDNCGYFKSLVDAYDLEIINTFEIDLENRGLTLQVSEKGLNAYDLAKEISLIKGVNMIEVSNIKSKAGAL